MDSTERPSPGRAACISQNSPEIHHRQSLGLVRGERAEEDTPAIRIDGRLPVESDTRCGREEPDGGRFMAELRAGKHRLIALEHGKSELAAIGIPGGVTGAFLADNVPARPADLHHRHRRGPVGSGRVIGADQEALEKRALSLAARNDVEQQPTSIARDTQVRLLFGIVGNGIDQDLIHAPWEPWEMPPPAGETRTRSA